MKLRFSKMSLKEGQGWVLTIETSKGSFTAKMGKDTTLSVPSLLSAMGRIGFARTTADMALGNLVFEPRENLVFDLCGSEEIIPAAAESEEPPAGTNVWGEEVFPAGKKSRDTTLDPTVDHPHHYGGAGDPYEAIKVIEAWGLNFCLGNVLKYICRSQSSERSFDQTQKDLRKALWYLSREVIDN